MELLSKQITNAPIRPIKVLQFGEGNFLRAFVDYMIDLLNEKTDFNGGISIIKPIPYGTLDAFRKQDCQYTVSLRQESEGLPQIENRVITSVANAIDACQEYEQFMELATLDSLRFLVSNTTEAGIVYDETDAYDLCPPRTYPGKLTKFLHHRYQHYHGDPDKGFILLPVELIDNNGTQLKNSVIQLAHCWGLEDHFVDWIRNCCIFCNTLVDRIVTGYPKEEAQAFYETLGYQDELLDTAEPFALWVIEPEKPEQILQLTKELPFTTIGLPVIFTDNHRPYKTRKVRILNGCQTGYTLAAYLCGTDYVLDAIHIPVIRQYIHEIIYKEILPTLPLPQDELAAFAASAIQRFHNPYIHHSLLAISLNSVSKWKTRCLPSLLDYEQVKHCLPTHLVFSMAALLCFYTGSEIRNGALIGYRDNREYEIRDDSFVLSFFAKYSQDQPLPYTQAVLSCQEFWGMDLTQINGLTELTSHYVQEIRTSGMLSAMIRYFS